jgi:hypothetical protein
MSDEEIQKAAKQLAEQLADKGRMIEGGWIGFMHACKIHNAPSNQLLDMRRSFVAGALHLFTTMMTVLDPGAEPTDRDLKRMDLVHAELKRFQQQFEAEIIKRKN